MDRDKLVARTLAKCLLEALEMRDNYVEKGMEPAEADRIVGHALMAEWGSGRRVTYRCPRCRDTGWVFKEVATKLYGPEWPTVQAASRCQPDCAFVAYERKRRQEALGMGDDPVAAAGRTSRGVRR